MTGDRRRHERRKAPTVPDDVPNLSPRDVAAMWNVDVKTVYALIQDGSLEAVPIRRLLRISRQAMRDYERGAGAALAAGDDELGGVDEGSTGDARTLTDAPGA